MIYIDCDIVILNSPVSYVSSYLYLGVDIDEMLTFKQFYTNCSKKNYCFLRRIRHMLTTKAALDVTNSVM